MKRILILLILLVSVCGGFAQSDFNSLQYRKMVQFLDLLNRSYVDTVDMNNLVEEAIRGVLSKLDPHSTYITPEEMKGVNEEFNANFEGIGIEFNILNDTLIVTNTINGGPAQTAGIHPDDKILFINDSLVVGISQTQVPKLLKGPKGTAVNLKVLRQGVDKLIGFRIIRDKVPITTIDAAYKIDLRSGYVKVNRFAATTNEELTGALRSLGEIDALVLDLRGNGGGYLEQAVLVAGNFLPLGSLIVSAQGRDGPISSMSFAAANPNYLKCRLVVLIDEFSASASEIVAGAVQDWDRGIIIGQRSFGKGLVQSQRLLVDGSAARITVARYLTPSGRAIQTPYQKGHSKEYYANFSDRLRRGDSTNAPKPDSTIYKTLRKGRVIYAAGGITPDIAVSDTAIFSGYWANVIRSGATTEFVLGYIDKNRNKLTKKYPGLESFISGFTVDDEILEEIAAIAGKRGVKLPEGSGAAESADNYIKIRMKALIARRLWDMSAYYRIVNEGIDETYRKAVEVLGDWERYGAEITGSGAQGVL